MFHVDLAPFKPSSSPLPAFLARPYVPEVDLYGGIHKGLRWVMFSTLIQLGRTQPTDRAQVRDALAGLRELLWLMKGHVHHENQFIHSSIEARRPGATARLGADHVGHETSLAELTRAVEVVEALESSPEPQRVGAWRALCLRCSAFVGENLVHMEEEEALAQPLLEELYSPEELQALHERLVASIPPQDMVRYLRVMLPAFTVEERVAMLEGPSRELPPEVFAQLLAAGSAELSPAERSQLQALLDEKRG